MHLSAPMSHPTIAITTVHEVLNDAGHLRFSAPLPSSSVPKDDSRIREAIDQAIVLRKLQTESADTGYLTMPLDDYLMHIAQMAGVRLPLQSSKQKHTSREGLASLKPWLAIANGLKLATD